MPEKTDSVSLHWFAPLNRIMGKKTLEAVGDGSSVADLLVRLREREPQLAAYAKWEDGDTKPWGLLLLRGSDMLRLDDRILPGETLDVLIMLDGG